MGNFFQACHCLAKLVIPINAVFISGAYRACFKYGCSNTEDRDEENADRVVVIFIHRPQGQARNLEDIERMKHLNAIVSQ